MARYLRLVIPVAAGLIVIVASVVAVLVIRDRGNSTGSTTAASSPARPATPGGPFTPSALNLIKNKDDALRLAVAFVGSELSSAQPSSVSFVQTNALAAWQMFHPDRPRPGDWAVADDATVWAAVAYGTFVRVTPGVGPCPCTYSTVWAIAVQNTDTVNGDFDFNSYDLSKLGNVIDVPKSEWSKYTR